ncbi:MAG: hypothetical protein HZB79_08725 [Deltaproteobacteria bacterium]|nr:hypothetical protein [Deltaproteobacteria bacterium]
MKNFLKQIPAVILLGLVPTFIFYLFSGSQQDFLTQVKENFVISKPILIYYVVLFIILLCLKKWLSLHGKGWFAESLQIVSSCLIGIYQAISGMALALFILLLIKEPCNVGMLIILIIITLSFAIFPKVMIDEFMASVGKDG